MRLVLRVLSLTGLASVVMLLMLGLWSLVPLAAGWTPAVVRTGSMSPTISPGDLVYYQPARDADVRPGRVVLADEPGHPGRLLSHRVVEIKPGGVIVTKGDANPTADSAPLAPGAVRGQARLVVPYIGLLTLVNQPEQRGRVVVFGAFVLLAAMYRTPREPGRHRPGRHALGSLGTSSGLRPAN